MKSGLIAVLLALAWFAFLLVEKALLRRARSRIRVVVHVNGTRGKSETTRLIAAALRASGIRTMAKTTGTEPRLIRPDGGEKRLMRSGAADVREQGRLVFEAARSGVDVLVAECMAVNPEAQSASDAFLAPSILAITNVRPDHLLELGDAESSLGVFASYIPKDGVVATADPWVAASIKRTADAAGARLLAASPLEGWGAANPDNAGLALAVALECGATREAALQGMSCYKGDPGAFAIRSFRVGAGGEAFFLDALAANDVVSSEILFAHAEKRLPLAAAAPLGERVLLIASRGDRPDRALAFAEWAADPARARGRWDRVALVGPLPLAARLKLAKAFPGLDAKGRRRLFRVGARGMGDFLSGLDGGSLVYGVGNWRGIGPIVREKSYEF